MLTAVPDSALWRKTGFVPVSFFMDAADDYHVDDTSLNCDHQEASCSSPR
jgi:hypothetical protein